MILILKITKDMKITLTIQTRSLLLSINKLFNTSTRQLIYQFINLHKKERKQNTDLRSIFYNFLQAS